MQLFGCKYRAAILNAQLFGCFILFRFVPPEGGGEDVLFVVCWFSWVYDFEVIIIVTKMFQPAHY